MKQAFDRNNPPYIISLFCNETDFHNYTFMLLLIFRITLICLSNTTVKPNNIKIFIIIIIIIIIMQYITCQKNS